LSGAKRAAIEALAAVHIETHGADVERSLAAVSTGRGTRKKLAELDDPQIEASLIHVRSQSTEQDAEQTATYSVGSATSDGQRFRVLRPHARGGLGAVFVALDTELHREVALKQMLDQYAADPVSRARFLVEAEVTGGLEHPGIVPVYGLGTYGDGRPYYAMRFIRGDTLKEAIEQFHGEPGRVSAGSGSKGVPRRGECRPSPEGEAIPGPPSQTSQGRGDFYGKLEHLLVGQSDPQSRSALGRAYYELGDLTARVGKIDEGVALLRKALALRREKQRWRSGRNWPMPIPTISSIKIS
jgi:hypothetical protein